MKKYRGLSMILCAVMLLSLVPMMAFAAKTVEPFQDVPSEAWYAEAVQYVYQNRLMNGVSETAFAPQNTTTRAMIVTILHRLAGSPASSAVNTFEDVAAGTWYTDAVRWAAGTGVVTGYSEKTFGPSDVITREQIAAILFRYAGRQGVDTVARNDLSNYTDKGSVSNWAAEAMQWAVSEGLMNGVTNTTLVPKGNTTRAQAATLLMRFAENFSPKPEETAKPVESAQPVESAKPVESVQPVESAKPVESAQPVESAKPVESAQPVESAKPVETAQPVETAKPVETAQPTAYTVTFTDYDGKVIATEQVPAGGNAALPSNPSRSGYYFAGWTGTYQNVTANQTVKASYVNDNAKNIFQITSANASKGDSVTVSLKLLGSVDLVDYDIALSYDSDALEVVSVSNKKMMADIVNHVEDTILLNFSTYENVNESDDVITITFKVKDGTSSNDAAIWFSDVKFVDKLENGAFVEADYNLIPGWIHISK